MEGGITMTALQVFNYENNEVRTVIIDGEPWWVLKDVCDTLGIQNPADVVKRLDDDERGRFNLGRQGEANIVNEFGLYNVILRSDKPEAKQFKRWVTHEVIPTIRKTGTYKLPVTYIEALEALVSSEKEKLQLVEQNAIMKPKADYFDELVDRNLLTGIRETAKGFAIGQKVFVNFLLNEGYCYRDGKKKLVPYMRHVTDGLFEQKEQYNETNQWSGTQTLITPKGRETFRLLLKGLSA